MSWNDPDPYYSPEHFGLTTFGEADAGGGYDFDKFVVWTRADGSFTWATDTGCSCPSPFEDLDVDDLPIGTARNAIDDLIAWIGPEDYWNRDARSGAAQRLLARLLEVA